MALLSIRPLERRDIPLVARYWTEATPADLARMGVNPERVTSAEPFQKGLEAFLATAPDKVTSFPTIWLVDGEAVGYSTAKDLIPGESAKLHLHVWAKAMRGQGYGGPLFCLTAISLYERFRLKTMWCEPKADNPFPNGMLKKIGFPLERTYFGASSDLAAFAELASYRIEREIADNFLSRYRRTDSGVVI